MGIRADSRLLRIYHRDELVKVDPPQSPGGRATHYTDYPATRTPYALISARQGADLAPGLAGRHSEVCA